MSYRVVSCLFRFFLEWVVSELIRFVAFRVVSFRFVLFFFFVVCACAAAVLGLNRALWPFIFSGWQTASEKSNKQKKWPGAVFISDF